MIDPVSAGLDALAHRDLMRLPAVFFAGVVTSIGPCVAPRFIALAALLERSRSRVPILAAFVGGLVLVYAALGCAAELVGAIGAYAGAIDALLACGLALCGIAVLVRDPHAHAGRVPDPARPSGAFVMGAGSALIVSPCCTPVVAAVAGMSAFSGSPALGALFLAAFAAGHALPLVLLTTSGSWVTHRFVHRYDGAASAVISGTLMLALAAYYGVLA